MGHVISSEKPEGFRLGIKPNGEPVLQGSFRYTEYNGPAPTRSWIDWVAIPTVKLDEQGKEI